MTFESPPSSPRTPLRPCSSTPIQVVQAIGKTIVQARLLQRHTRAQTRTKEDDMEINLVNRDLSLWCTVLEESHLTIDICLCDDDDLYKEHTLAERWTMRYTPSPHYHPRDRSLSISADEFSLFDPDSNTNTPLGSPIFSSSLSTLSSSFTSIMTLSSPPTTATADTLHGGPSSPYLDVTESSGPYDNQLDEVLLTKLVDQLSEMPIQKRMQHVHAKYGTTATKAPSFRASPTQEEHFPSLETAHGVFDLSVEYAEYIPPWDGTRTLLIVPSASSSSIVCGHTRAAHTNGARSSLSTALAAVPHTNGTRTSTPPPYHDEAHLGGSPSSPITIPTHSSRSIHPVAPSKPRTPSGASSPMPFHTLSVPGHVPPSAALPPLSLRGTPTLRPSSSASAIPSPTPGPFSSAFNARSPYDPFSMPFSPPPSRPFSLASDLAISPPPLSVSMPVRSLSISSPGLAISPSMHTISTTPSLISPIKSPVRGFVVRGTRNLSISDEHDSISHTRRPATPRALFPPRSPVSPPFITNGGGGGSSDALTSPGFAGSFQESILSGHMSTTASTSFEGFVADLGVSGKDLIPPHKRLPFQAVYYHVDPDTPYVGTVDLPEKGYRVPEKGLVQLTLFNPTKTPIKTFLVPYDLSGMPPLTKTFLRQKIVTGTPPLLRYAVHLRFASPKKKRFYLYRNIRVVFPSRVPDEVEKLILSYEGPQDCKYFPY
eukprot:TRINITY_DN17043_c0_g1_i7.p1 TRINITY_DN17043_c0_g1~~TRINITY_DN17043_c0_g1_i7.p1  ORF type:complete len:713 (-),score=162.66 TRINITY_DN17043_c0_g1_i7:59-2197(-)